MHLDLTDDEAAALLRELDGLIDGDRYFMSRRIKTLKALNFASAHPWGITFRSAASLPR
jgi:hypothetical protein